ncbi:hypothetical protein AcV7_006226 [Taiwanofungus camphoratus]|nr:hypothetical protein AcV7_006226 [Antrodia cinnamomea]
MAVYKPGSSSTSLSQPARSEFDILKASHKFLRDEDDEQRQLSWDAQLAKKYYANLYREYAVCDLKHYKSGNFALRWRTESEVISGAGETTCGNTRCLLHNPVGADGAKPPLKTLELPFSYVEEGENKFALVKVVLCDKCCKKLMWKRTKEREEELGEMKESGDTCLIVEERAEKSLGNTERQHSREKDSVKQDVEHRDARFGHLDSSTVYVGRLGRNSRSRSPRRDKAGTRLRRERSPRYST